MAIFEVIDRGSAANDGTGDPAREWARKTNDNFDKAANITTENTFAENQIIEKDGGSDACMIISNNGASVNCTLDLLEVTGGVDPDFGTASVFGFRIWLDGVNNEFKLDSGNSTTVNNRLSMVRDTGLLEIPSVYSLTTATAANVNVDASGGLRRSTSSEIYKDVLGNISDDYAEKIFEVALESCIFYKSKCDADNKKHTHYGISAEKLAKIEPRLVHWGYQDHDYENGVLKKDTKMSPIGVQYDRFVPLILVVMNKFNNRISALEKKVK